MDIMHCTNNPTDDTHDHFYAHPTVVIWVSQFRDWIYFDGPPSRELGETPCSNRKRRYLSDDNSYVPGSVAEYQQRLQELPLAPLNIWQHNSQRWCTTLQQSLTTGKERSSTNSKLHLPKGKISRPRLVRKFIQRDLEALNLFPNSECELQSQEREASSEKRSFDSVKADLQRSLSLATSNTECEIYLRLS